MSFETSNYIKVENFISPELCNIFKMYALFDELNDFTGDLQYPSTHSRCADCFTESLLLHLKSKMENITIVNSFLLIHFLEIIQLVIS